MDGKIDRRVIKTKERLYRVFIELLSEKPVKDITVKELSEKADINRATFYLHYNDVFDLLSQIEAEIIHDFENVCENLTSNFTDAEFIAAFKKLLDFIRDNEKLCIGLFVSNSDRGFFERLVKIVMDKCFDNISYNIYDFSFAVAGCVGIVMHWINSGMQETSSEIADRTLHLLKKISN